MVHAEKSPIKKFDLREGLLLKEKLAKFFRKTLVKIFEKAQKCMERDYWMSAEEAVKYGLVDKIIKQEK